MYLEEYNLELFVVYIFLPKVCLDSCSYFCFSYFYKFQSWIFFYHFRFCISFFFCFKSSSHYNTRVFSGKKKIYIHANTREQIIESVQTFKRHGINNLVIVGADDAYYAIDFIKENNLPILLNNIHRTPSRNQEDVDLPYKLPYLLYKEGILVGLTASGSLHSQRNLPFLAGTSVAYGVPKEEALKMISYNTPKILGIDNLPGTLEVG